MKEGAAMNRSLMKSCMPAALKMTKIRMAPADRADILINFNDYPEGSEVFLVNKFEQGDGRKPTGKILRLGMQMPKFMVAMGAAPVKVIAQATPKSPAALRFSNFIATTHDYLNQYDRLPSHAVEVPFSQGK
jgi:hypothetical protein